MNIKLNAVAITVVASLSGVMSVAHAGFNETPYVSYLSGEDFDVAFPGRQAATAKLLKSDLSSVVRVADTSKRVAGVKEDELTVNGGINVQAGKVVQNVSTKPAPVATESAAEASAKTSVSPSCPADEIGYIAPCI